MKLKLALLLSFGALVLTHPFPAHALDCTKATSSIEKLFCTTPELKKADDAMSAAYFKLLRETKDPEFHEALIRSQRRWLEVRSHGPDRFGAAESDDTDDREVLLKMTRDRLDFLRTGKPIRVMEEQRKIGSRDGGGAFAGYEFDCTLYPPPYANWTYACYGETHRQHNDRICSIGQEWASGHVTEFRLVSVLKDGEPKPVASCYTGYAGMTCPDPENTDVGADAHWNTNPSIIDVHPPRAGNLWKFDPDAPSAASEPWARDCLFASTYPPPYMSRPDPSPQK